MESSPNGTDLMLMVARGESGAFEMMVKIYQKQVINTIYRYLGDADTAEDLSQEVFMRIYNARTRYKPLAKFETWLHRIIYNLVVNEAQSRKKRGTTSIDPIPQGSDRAKPAHPVEGLDPLEQLQRDELHQRVKTAVTDLPPNQRMVLILNKYEDMSYQEIAAALETTVEAVKSMLFRAREKVRNKLRSYLNSEVHDD